MGLPKFGQMIQIPKLNRKFTIGNSFLILIRPGIDGKIWIMSFLEVYFLCWGIYESILFIVSVFIFFVLCFHRFHGDTFLKYCFDFLCQKKNTMSIFNFDKDIAIRNRRQSGNTAFSWILMFNLEFRGGPSNSASTFFYMAIPGGNFVHANIKFTSEIE